jgi:hypothetical protein
MQAALPHLFTYSQGFICACDRTCRCVRALRTLVCTCARVCMYVYAYTCAHACVYVYVCVRPDA